jgi:hypothetical protein
MTNKEYIIKVLSEGDPFDDGGVSYEALVHYHIDCPYSCGDERAHCHNKPLGYPDRKHCVACKMEWLDMEVDT